MRPHEARREIGDRAVAVVDEVIRAVAGIVADVAEIHRLPHRAAAAGRVFGITLDAAIGEVDAENRGVAVHRRADVGRRRPILTINDALRADAAAVGEAEVIRVNERNVARRVRHACPVDAGEFDQWCKGQTGYPIVDAGMRELN
ncbi:MAG: hypothetical protein NTZ16_06935, partial [Verrucomicrobia bacterium]|nr:hypothetical protein [Verrucomicrobiota bacterium]